ncbi:5-carboxymethyl-2-hydroxymuconate Delta-isomerase [Vibrio sp. EJY3]|uniref:5-carboxymethyl-2-hydroxymuconate Delta-isomerase n=1 Tax=Vibrio sp. (strain EJY3) TaxID=1116375 RepID=UPI000243BE9B|nr:5-carboxymethyl-2-hydroxymuconate isomerase [Vibrio sp. EJY3]AEX22249.1 5-carboxymethyl-2-hydroxymuconate isomerase [Vibrio sp. EJY3]
MPHCIIEHSSSIEPVDLNQKVFLGALESNLFESDGSDIKVRSIAYENYQTGSAKEDFIHVTLRILSGRNEQDKLLLSNSVMSRLKSIQLVSASLTVEVVDIDRNSYAKQIV